MKPFLKEHYEQNVVPELKKKFGYTNVHQVPRIEKIVINHGFDTQVDKNQIEEAVKEISNIACQKAVVTKARVSISNFKLREGEPIGVKVTLRGASMYEFLLRAIAIALPESVTFAVSITSSTATAITRSASTITQILPKATATTRAAPSAWTSQS
jgi:large subunit ribosomal protein L5